jgi:tetratricopeptide (TPR) repeat protein
MSPRCSVRAAFALVIIVRTAATLSPVRAADPAVAAQDEQAALLKAARAKLDEVKNDEARALLDQAVKLAPNSSAVHEMRGELEAQDLNNEAAFAELKQALTLDPKNVEALKYRGLLSQMNGGIDQAVADYTAVIALNPRDRGALFGRGECYATQGKSAEAEAAFDAVIGLDPEPSPAYVDRADVRCARGDYAKAMDDCREYLKTHPGDVRAVEIRAKARRGLGQLREALADYDRLLRQSYNAKYRLARGEILLSLGNAASALYDFDAVVADNKVAAYLDRAGAYLKLGRYEQCRADLAKLEQLAADPKDVSPLRDELAAAEKRSGSAAPAGDVDAEVAALWKRAEELRDLEGYEDVRQIADRILKMTKPTAAYYIRRSRVFRGQWVFQDALNSLKEAIALEPNNAEAYAARACLYADNRGQKEAEADIAQAERLDPNCATTYWARAKLRHWQGSDLTVGANYDKAVELDPKNTDILMDRVQTMRFRGKQALDEWTRILALDPDNTDALFCRALDLSHTDVTASLRDYDKVVELAPSETAYYSRAEARYSAGDYAGAIRDFDAARDAAFDGRTNFWWEELPKQRGDANYKLQNYAAAARDYAEAIRGTAAYDFLQLERPLAWETKEQLAARAAKAAAVAQTMPESAEARRDYGLASYSQGDFTRALAEFDAGLKTKPGDLELSGLRAMTLWHLGRSDEGDQVSAAAIAKRRALDQADGRDASGVELMQKYLDYAKYEIAGPAKSSPSASPPPPSPNPFAQ